jgi:hypothetical protein
LLCFSDEGLARVAIAGTAVPREERHDWLQRVAARLEQARPRKTSRDWMRAARARERDGIVVLKLAMDEAGLVIGLIDGGVLNPLQADNRIELAKAAQRALAMFCEGSQFDGRIYDTLAESCHMARSYDPNSELSRLVRRSGSPTIDDIAEVISVALALQKREIIEHVNRLLKMFNSSTQQLDARVQRETGRTTELSRRVFAAESEIRRIRAGKP